MKFCVNFSNLNIEINSIYDYTYNYVKEYLTDGKPDFSVETTEEKIDAEVNASDFNPPRSYAESICIYREIANTLPNYNRCVFHGAVIEYKGRGYLFTAPSGTGKTTHIRLWKQFLGDDCHIVNGDKPILHIQNGRVIAYSTPYAGKEGYQNHSSVELKGICLIQRGENRIERAHAGDYLTDLMRQIYMPSSAVEAVQTLELLDNLIKAVPFYVLHCDISEQAFKTSFNALNGDE